jgi:hypothetical protein
LPRSRLSWPTDLVVGERGKHLAGQRALVCLGVWEEVDRRNSEELRDCGQVPQGRVVPLAGAQQPQVRGGDDALSGFGVDRIGHLGWCVWSAVFRVDRAEQLVQSLGKGPFRRAGLPGHEY